MGFVERRNPRYTIRKAASGEPDTWCPHTLTRLGALGTLSRSAGEGLQAPGWVGEGLS